jgi:hypothetical protein
MTNNRPPKFVPCNSPSHLSLFLGLRDQRDGLSCYVDRPNAGAYTLHTALAPSSRCLLSSVVEKHKHDVAICDTPESACLLYFSSGTATNTILAASLLRMQKESSKRFWCKQNVSKIHTGAYRIDSREYCRAPASSIAMMFQLKFRYGLSTLQELTLQPTQRASQKKKRRPANTLTADIYPPRHYCPYLY